MGGRKFLFTSEQISDGHPDKMCDIISDSVLDAFLSQDPQSKVACETLIKNNTVVLGGEVNSKATIDFEAVVRTGLRPIGYHNADVDFCPETCQIINLIDVQSPEIARSVHENKADEDIGAGDQGLMMGYATNETEEMLPMTLVLATKLILRIKQVRAMGTPLSWLRPDVKTQVTIEYEQKESGHIVPLRIHTILMSVQHTPNVGLEELRVGLRQHIIDAVVPAELIDNETKFFLNPSTSFVVGGPKGDAGVTGRKIIADTYGGWGGHGGGAFSGKDATKVDRSAAYAARWIAKSLVTAGFCDRCLVQVTYGIGLAKPISLYVDSYGTVKDGLDDSKLTLIAEKNFDLRPGMLLKELKLERPIYRDICILNHFMPKPNSTWEIPKAIKNPFN